MENKVLTVFGAIALLTVLSACETKTTHPPAPDEHAQARHEPEAPETAVTGGRPTSGLKSVTWKCLDPWTEAASRVLSNCGIVRAHSFLVTVADAFVHGADGTPLMRDGRPVMEALTVIDIEWKFNL
jgi:hypothetical protein